MTDRMSRMHAALTAAFQPSQLDIVDDSARHAGHAGAAAGGQTHYAVTIVSDAFDGLNRVDRHKRVNHVLADEFATGLHALQIKAKAPNEG